MTAFCVTETKSVLYVAVAENFKNVKDKSVKEWNSMKDRYMEFLRARREEAEEILQLYRSLIGTEYCVWTENYPTEREVEFDLSRNALFCLYEKMPEPDGRGRLIGTISIDDDPEVEALSCWSEDLTPVAELSRLGVAVEYQNRGIARILLQEAMTELKSQGYKAAHILVAKDNVKALRSYEKLHFTTAGECELFGHSYWCYEKEL